VEYELFAIQGPVESLLELQTHATHRVHVRVEYMVVDFSRLLAQYIAMSASWSRSSGSHHPWAVLKETPLLEMMSTS
jgi:hypothetical protein